MCLGGCLLMWGRISGLEKGYFHGVFRAAPVLNGFGSDVNYYQHFNNWYFYITLAFGIYLFGKLFKPSFISGAICVVALAAAFQQHLDLLGLVGFGRKLSGVTLYIDNIWTRNAERFHWVLFVIVIVLLAAEFFLMNARKAEITAVKTG